MLFRLKQDVASVIQTYGNQLAIGARGHPEGEHRGYSENATHQGAADRLREAMMRAWWL